MGGRIHQVKRGETIVQIAHQSGFRGWQPIWDHPENAALRARRPNAYLLAPGDALFVPERAVKDHSCATNKQHVFRVRKMTQLVQQVVLDADSRPLAGRPYKLTAGSTVVEGKTGGDGLCRAEIPVDVKEAELEVSIADGEPPVTWSLALGHLAPLDEVDGLKAHLNNLGYDCGPGGALDERARAALRQFQRDHGLEPTGEADAATRDKLHALHGYPREGAS